ncbi:Glycosyl transferases group 1 [Halorientalis persicus]|uniref:Glycosyl transferases group 1 n=1 Tax=Halorientalis persicus TaxID=1367881 RepID=A0A1H8V553_9EURY|nr:glycosyltransferase family 4 protein [Halorientalis persicus]SEP10555.1 Glycosyl transferases group 1 [Halorientalis persicus]
MDLRILNLVTDPRPFYRQQVSILESRGIEQVTLQVPGREDQFDSRSGFDYLSFYPNVLRESLGDYDIVHANFGLTGPFAIAQPSRPIVLSLWGSDVHDSYGIVGKQSAKYFDAVIVMTEEMASQLPVDSYVIPHGIDLAQFKPYPRDRSRERVGWDDGKHVLFPYAPYRGNKNYQLAKDVVDEVDDKMETGVKLQAVYDVEYQEMPFYMNAADALLITSDNEGSPNTVKEAMACNLPVISRDVGNIRKMLSGVTPSEVVSTNDELVTALTTVLSMGDRSNGRDEADKFGLETMGDRILDVYKEVLSGSLSRQ